MGEAGEPLSAMSPAKRSTGRLARTVIRVTGAILILLGLLRISFPALLSSAIVQSPGNVSSCETDGSLFIDMSVRKGVQVVDVDGRRLSMAYYHCRPKSPYQDRHLRWKVVLLHGHGDCKESQLPLARELVRRGHQVVLPDLPAHNESDGDYVTFGVREGKAIAGIIDSLFSVDSSGSGGEGILLWGFSLGGATAIHAAVHNNRVGAVVSVSAFSSLREVVPDYLDEFFPVHPLLISPDDIDGAIMRAGRIAGFDPNDASTTRMVARLRVPLLLMHGGSDSRMPVEHALRIRRAARDPVRLEIIPAAGHTDIYSRIGVDLLTEIVIEWLDQVRLQEGE